MLSEKKLRELRNTIIEKVKKIEKMDSQALDVALKAAMPGTTITGPDDEKRFMLIRMTIMGEFDLHVI